MFFCSIFCYLSLHHTLHTPFSSSSFSSCSSCSSFFVALGCLLLFIACFVLFVLLSFCRHTVAQKTSEVARFLACLFPCLFVCLCSLFVPFLSLFMVAVLSSKHDQKQTQPDLCDRNGRGECLGVCVLTVCCLCFVCASPSTPENRE